MCGNVQEDTMHALVLCDFAKAIWERSSLPISNIVTNVFHIWFSELLNILDSNRMLYATAILYHIWRARNGAVWDAVMPRPTKLLATVTATIEAWRNARLPPQPVTQPQQHTHTVAQPHNTAAQLGRTCHMDAGYLHDSGVATVGAILLDADGRYVAAFSAPLPTCFSPLMAEALACKEALSWLKNRGETSVHLYTDCLSLQRYLIAPSSSVRSYVGYALDSCKSTAASFNSCSFNFIPRTDNYLAHALASAAFQQPTILYWDLCPPDIIAAFF
ncbi:PREDICTED: uncharacterized protein LOC109166112 [Ipomoea nil]|uniref:uncharacterized protein LOC109166112 n=1 Tax=Ipomoea nil TaxID=35883 RepID=UPI0009015895|nr:PREDICTED: uncharacterized protein LOC109166112 [Ipomoea nil]